MDEGSPRNDDVADAQIKDPAGARYPSSPMTDDDGDDVHSFTRPADDARAQNTSPASSDDRAQNSSPVTDDGGAPEGPDAGKKGMTAEDINRQREIDAHDGPVKDDLVGDVLAAFAVVVGAEIAFGEPVAEAVGEEIEKELLVEGIQTFAEYADSAPSAGAAASAVGDYHKPSPSADDADAQRSGSTASEADGPNSSTMTGHGEEQNSSTMADDGAQNSSTMADDGASSYQLFDDEAHYGY